MADAGGWRIGRGLVKDERGNSVFRVFVDEPGGDGFVQIFSHDSADKEESARLVDELVALLKHIDGEEPRLFMGDE